MAIERRTAFRIAEVLLILSAAVSGTVLFVNLVHPQRAILALFIGGSVFTVSLILLIRIWLDPDRIRASQSDTMLTLASDTLEFMSENGMSSKSAQRICERILPATSAVAVALTDTERILGYAGRDSELHPLGSPIATAVTQAVINDGLPRVLRTKDEIGLPESSTVRAAIIAPLTLGEETIGTLKFYYPSARRINETQQSIVLGFAELLSTQASARALEDQRKLATSMELKVLQSQINPHFLFNTINTIASLIRTDPDHARDLLREFAVFYRSTLENSADLITLQRELDQTRRYFGFEVARFGEERLSFSTDVEVGAENCLVPAFMVQPLVENAVRHGMPSEGTLHVACEARRSEGDLIVMVSDDGVGMTSDVKAGLESGESSDSLGIAMRNIQERVKGYFGLGSSMQVESSEGAGTRVMLLLKGACANTDLPSAR
ncbi:MAG: histidine kinase [Eggerthellaceae bacterium]|nr:histidine kinase [Eggerthellaceae bacterium]